MDFKFPRFHVFLQSARHVSGPDYEHIPNFTFCSSDLKISYSAQWTSFLISRSTNDSVEQYILPTDWPTAEINLHTPCDFVKACHT